MAERQGVEPCEPFYLSYGLANRCLTIRPTLHFGGRRRSRTPSLLREPGFQGQSQDQPRCIIFQISVRYFCVRNLTNPVSAAHPVFASAEAEYGYRSALLFMVLPPRIEQGSSDFQSVAMTTSAKEALG